MAASMSGIVCRVLRTNLTPIMTTRNTSISLGWQISLCNYHASSCLFKGSKRDRRMDKMFTKKKKKFYYDPMNVAQLGRLATGASGTSKTKMQSEDSIRLRTYNKILFDNINEMMTTSLISEELEELQLTVLGVRVSGDMSACRVYWMSTGAVEEDGKIEEVLGRYRGPLRRALVSHRVLGKIPPIFFLKDKVRAKISEIDRLISIADFGPDEEDRVINGHDYQEPDRPEIDGRIEFMQRTDKANLVHRGGTPQPSLFGIDHDAVHRMISANKSMDHDNDVKTELDEMNLDKKFEQFRVFLKKKKLSKADRKQAAFYKGELEAFRSGQSREISDSSSADEEQEIQDKYYDDEYDIQDNEDEIPLTDKPTKDN